MTFSNTSSNTAWGSSLWPYLQHLRSALSLALSDISSLLSSPLHSSPSLPESRLRAFSARLRWGAFAAAGLYFGLTASVGDWLNSYGVDHLHMPSIQLAAKLFPWNRYIRTKPAYFALAWAPPSEESIDLISSVLRTDPFSADLTNGLAMHLYGVADDFRANATWRAFTRIAPNSPHSKRIEKALEA